MSRAPTDWKKPEMRARIAKRYRSEAFFRFMGLAALVTAAAFLVFLLYTVVSQGWRGFQMTEVKLSVTYDRARMGLPANPTPAQLAAIDYQALAIDAATTTFGFESDDIVSEGGWLALREAVQADPSLIGKRADIWVAATSDVDMVAKGHVDRSTPALQRSVDDKFLDQYDQLKARGLIRTTFNTTFLSTADSTNPELAGVWGATKGTFLTLLITLVISFPIGVLTAVYLEEFAPRNRWTDVIEVSINNLAAVPSIIFGLLGLAVFLNFFDMPRSAPIVGGLTLALMTLPVIVIAGRVAIKSVPPSIRDAALGIGASPVQVVFHHVLPLALPGILTVLMIGMRAFIADVPSGLSNPATVLPVQIFLWSDDVQRGFVEKTSAAIMVLLVFLLLMNGVAIYLRNKFERRW